MHEWLIIATAAQAAASERRLLEVAAQRAGVAMRGGPGSRDARDAAKRFTALARNCAAYWQAMHALYVLSNPTSAEHYIESQYLPGSAGSLEPYATDIPEWA